MSPNPTSPLDRMRDAVAANTLVRMAAAVIAVARGIANSPGGRDLGGWLSYGRYELASVLMHGSASIYPGRPQSPLEQGPDVLPSVPHLTEPDFSPALTGPAIEPLYTEEQMSSVKAQANIAYAMSKADRMNVHELTFDVANVNHSGPLTPSHVPAPSENRPEVQVGPPVESLVDRHLESVRGLESTQPELSREVAASHVAPAASMVDKHLQNIENTVELAAPQIELDVDR